MASGHSPSVVRHKLIETLAGEKPGKMVTAHEFHSCMLELASFVRDSSLRWIENGQGKENRSEKYEIYLSVWAI